MSPLSLFGGEKHHQSDKIGAKRATTYNKQRVQGKNPLLQHHAADDKFTDLEKKTFWESFLSDVFIYEEEQKDGRILKGVRFKDPIYIMAERYWGWIVTTRVTRTFL